MEEANKLASVLQGKPIIAYCFNIPGQNALQAVYQQLKMVEREIQFNLNQLQMFDLFPIMKPKDYVDPDTGEVDDTWLYPCKVNI